jgi:hypothetical protein
MNALLPKQRTEARKRGWQALGAWGVAGLLGTWGWAWAFPALVAAGAAVWLTRRWFQFRAQWGLRF